MASRIELGINPDTKEMKTLHLSGGQFTELISPDGGMVRVVSHDSGTWFGWTGRGPIEVKGRASIKEGEGVNLHTSGAFVQIGELKVEHVK